MSNFIIIGACFLAGFVARHWGRFPPDSHRSLNAFIISISLPCLEFVPLRHAVLDGNFLIFSVMPWFLFGVSILFFSILGKKFEWDESTKTCLYLSAGLGNTSFLGIPLVEAYYGKDGIPTAVVINQLGTFLALSLPGTYFGTKAMLRLKKESESVNLIKRLFSFPPFWGLLIVLASRPLVFPLPLEQAISRIGDTLTPLALFSVGYQLPRVGNVNYNLADAENPSGASSAPLVWGLVYKLLLGPFMVWFCFGSYYFFTDPTFRQAQPTYLRDFKILVMEAGMAPMITGSLLAAEWGLKPRLAVSLVGIGIPLSFVTTMGLYYLLEKWAWIGTIFFGP
ncbi:transporter, auxin efflux carrier domain protein [Leptospira broomii serovar Hurstbridge str. 5399]|uniref:Transporter, auxin efflux carrier domain protein n=1 Tax=Leptospira broomii serovar Hurstbridge str. 5399 TaxID=1049789 RepID=T0EYL8_9LEPT|nr:AEC family transporter [Leptospira broomii]EQA43965.1 transporter, auxin efflux carrier domain protein [Leptospira broomii serovar Hurstbridge str. 5399]